MSVIKVIVAGGRHFNDFGLVEKHLANLPAGSVIVSGGATGADSLGERFANENGYDIVRFPAEWDKYGKRAGYLRNKQMAEYGTCLLAFWDGKSRGTKMMINLAKEQGIPVKVVRY
jgi:hypothetical protein